MEANIIELNIEKDKERPFLSKISGSFESTDQLMGLLGNKIEYIDLRLHGIMLSGHVSSKVLFMADAYTMGEPMVDTEADMEFGATLLKAYREPHAGDLYRHHNGNEYMVTQRANDESDRPDYPVTIVYSGRNGRVWAKTENNFVQKMTFVRNLTEQERLEFYR